MWTIAPTIPSELNLLALSIYWFFILYNISLFVVVDVVAFVVVVAIVICRLLLFLFLQTFDLIIALFGRSFNRCYCANYCIKLSFTETLQFSCMNLKRTTECYTLSRSQNVAIRMKKKLSEFKFSLYLSHYPSLFLKCINFNFRICTHRVRLSM